METDITYFAKTNFRGKEHVFGIKRDDRRRHMYVIGKTGMGKTNLLETMIITDIKAGNGIAVVDPHGDLAEKILNFVPASRINDVVYFNPADVDYPIAFNVMEQVDPKYRHLVASGLIGVFKKIWADSWGPRLEYLLRNVILALLEYPGSTLLGVPRMFIDKDYRKKVVNKVTDPVVKAFWLNEFTKYSSQFTVDAISPIQNKVGQFLSSSLVRNIISQTNSTIDMREIMDNKKILILNLAKGKIGEDYSALLGAMLITKIQLAAMGRSDIPEEERKDFYLYVDEFQNFATESFAGILSEARKYRLNLIVAHQYIGQLEEEVRDAIFGNVGTLIAFRVGAADAEWLEKEFEPVFMMNDLVNLAKYDVYLKLMIDGVTGDAFSATTLPPLKVTEQSSADKIIRVSRERYANKREVVEEKISRWSGMNEENKGEENKKESAAYKKSEYEKKEPKETRQPKETKQGSYARETEEKEMWSAVCEICGEKIRVPFKPDPKRSTYCKNCLADVRKQMAESMKTGGNNFGKKTEKQEIAQKAKPEIETKKIKAKEIDLENNFIKQNAGGKKEDENKPAIKPSIQSGEARNKKQNQSQGRNKEIIAEDNLNSQKKEKVLEEPADAILEDDFSPKNISKNIIEDIPKNISKQKTLRQLDFKKSSDKSKNLEIKEGEVVKF